MNTFLLLCSALLLQGQDLYRGRGGEIHFTSDAPLELIQAQSNQLSGIISVSENTFAFSVPTMSFEGFNSPLQQEHFHENYMESARFPQASFSGKFIEDISSLKDGLHEVRTKGKLNIHGEIVERIIKCQLEKKASEIIITSDFMVPLTDHNISIPQVVHQKIAEEIKVRVKIGLKK